MYVLVATETPVAENEGVDKEDGVFVILFVCCILRPKYDSVYKIS